MKHLPFILGCLFFFACKTSDRNNDIAEPPVAKQVSKTFSEHGNTRTDEYYWLNDPSDSNVIRHLEQENAYVETIMKPTEALQKTLYDEMVARIEQNQESLPVKKNGYWYYTRYEEGEQYPKYCRKKGERTAVEEVMLDVNRLSQGHQIYMLRGWSADPQNRMLAYGEDTTGGRICTTRFKDLQSGETLPATIANTSGEYAWSADGKTLFYVTNDHTVRPYKVWRHVMGTDPSTDVNIYTEKDSTFDVSLTVSKNNRYIFIVSGSTTTTEAHWLDAGKPLGNPTLIQTRTRDLLYYPYYLEGNVFHIYNNQNAKDFKVSSVPISNPGMAGWTDVIPHRDSALLERFQVLKNYIVAQHVVKGLSRITVTDRRNNSSWPVEFTEDAYVLGMSMATDDYASDSIRYNYTSLTTPSTDFMYVLGSKEKTLLKQEKVGGGYDQALYDTKRIWAKAKDGTMVPVSVVWRKDKFKKDGSNPMLLYAYGSYGWSSEPYFDASVISLLDRGFVYGIAHVRGGQEMGRYWYEDGKLLKKKNTFTDFIDCAEFFVKEKYTSKDKLFANGLSAGGMLMGAITNMRPDLFRGVIAEVPWMDVITDMYNSDLFLTTLEYDEWGDPRKKEYYDYMLSYSPYDNVKKANYPAILATGGLNDTQVAYFSPAKWVQRLRANNNGKNLVLFKCNMGAGHSGESGRFEAQKLTALKWAFMMAELEK